MENQYQPEDKPLLTHRSTSYHREIPKKRRNFACGSILLTVMLEKLAFYGITFYFVLFLSDNPFLWLQYDAASASLIFLTVSYLFSVIGGVLADSSLGRFPTLVLSLILCLCASSLLIVLGKAQRDYVHKDATLVNKMCGMNITDFEDNYVGEDIKVSIFQSNCFLPIMTALIVYAIGSGSLRANLTPFGAEQVRYGGSQSMHSFFNWYYWAINAGSLIALLGVSYIQQYIDFFIGYIVPSIALLLAAFVFLLGRIWYVTKKPTGSVLFNTFRIILEAMRRRKHRRVIKNRMMSSGCDLGFGPIPSFLDMAKDRYGGSFHDSIVEDVKSLGKVCVVFLALVPYWIIYYQMQTTFVIQGLHLNIFIGNSSKENSGSHTFDKIPVAWLSVFNIMAVLILVPLMDRVVFIILERRGWQVSQLRRMTVGMFFSVLAVLSAGVLETVRLNCWDEHESCRVNQTINNSTYNAAKDVTIFAQIPQYFLIGVSEVFASVAGLEFAYSQAPRSMQGLIMGLFYLSHGMGTLIGSLFIKVMSGKNSLLTPKDSGNINYGHLDYYFYVLTVVQLIAAIFFAIVAYFFERKKELGNNVQEDQNEVPNYLGIRNDGRR